MLVKLAIILINAYSLLGDESCYTECSKEGTLPCGTWLIRETNAGVAGTYELSKGVVNMSCEFTSLPEPAVVTWLKRDPNGASWSEFACSSKEENKQCRTSEHRVTSRCLLRTNQLNMTASYRCQATTKDHASKAISSEVAISVVGIDKISVVDYSLPYGKLGHVEVEVCANPKPEIFWVTSEAILRPHEASHRISSTMLHNKKTRVTEDGPATIVPYCYRVRLVVRHVQTTDTFQLVVKGETETRTEPLKVTVTGVPRSAVMSFSLLSFIFGIFRLL